MKLMLLCKIIDIIETETKFIIYPSGNLLHLHGLIGFEQEVGRHKNDGESTTNTNKKRKSGHDNTQKKKMKKKQM